MTPAHQYERANLSDTAYGVQGRRIARQATSGLTVTRVAENSGSISFAGTSYRVGNPWRRRSVQVSIVASSVQLSCDGQIVRVHPIRHDRSATGSDPTGRCATINFKART
jgi:hypothetical protein